MSNGELLVADAQPALGDLVDRPLADRDQAHVRAVVRLEVAGVDAHPLGSERVVVRAQELGELGVVHALADLAADELAHQLVRLRIREEVAVGRVEAEPADRVALLELALALLGRRVPDALLACVPGIPGRRRARHAAEHLVARLAVAHQLGLSGPFQAGTLKFAVRWNTVS